MDKRRYATGRNIEVDAVKEVTVMKAKAAKKKLTDEEYYDKRGVLGEIVEGEVTLSLDDALRQDILSAKKKITEYNNQA